MLAERLRLEMEEACNIVNHTVSSYLKIEHRLHVSVKPFACLM
jgi:hypothetical protein